MVCFQLVSVTDVTNTLQIFSSIRIPHIQFTNQSRRDDVVNVTFHSRHFEIHFAGFDFAVAADSDRPALLPSFARRRTAWPFAMDVIPGNGSFLGAESFLAEAAAAEPISATSTIEGFQYFCSFVTTVGAGHVRDLR